MQNQCAFFQFVFEQDSKYLYNCQIFGALTGKEGYILSVFQVMASGYWTPGGPADTGGVPPGPETDPSPFIRHNRHDWRRNNRSHDRIRTTEKSDDEEDTTPVLGQIESPFNISQFRFSPI